MATSPISYVEAPISVSMPLRASFRRWAVTAIPYRNWANPLFTADRRAAGNLRGSR